MKRKIILLTAAGLLAAGNSAKAQALYAQVGDPIAISSLTDASAQGGVTYEWYREGVLIPSCNEASCLIPTNLATGTNVKFQRRAIALGCAIGNSSNANTVTITFCNVVLDGVCWSNVNVDAWRTFAEQADVNTAFYQFNRTKAWDVDGASVTGWVTTSPAEGDWHVDSSPCPAGWRLPTKDEYIALDANSNPTGGVWVAASSNRGNAVAGRFYGKRAGSCSLPDDMTGCVFFPASGGRNYSVGTLTTRDASGYCWSSTQVSSTNGYYLYFISTSSYPTYNNSKLLGLPIRCVR